MTAKKNYFNEVEIDDLIVIHSFMKEQKILLCSNRRGKIEWLPYDNKFLITPAYYDAPPFTPWHINLIDAVKEMNSLPVEK